MRLCQPCLLPMTGTGWVRCFQIFGQARCTRVCRGRPRPSPGPRRYPSGRGMPGRPTSGVKRYRRVAGSRCLIDPTARLRSSGQRWKLTLRSTGRRLWQPGLSPGMGSDWAKCCTASDKARCKRIHQRLRTTVHGPKRCQTGVGTPDRPTHLRLSAARLARKCSSAHGEWSWSARD